MVWGKVGFLTCHILAALFHLLAVFDHFIPGHSVLCGPSALLTLHWISPVDFSSFIIHPVFLGTCEYAEHLELWHLPSRNSFTVTFFWCDVTACNYCISCLCPFFCFLNVSLKAGRLLKVGHPNQVVIHRLKGNWCLRPATKDQWSPYNQATACHSFV